jgi:chemotaxis methyl-accepting protein methylase
VTRPSYCTPPPFRWQETFFFRDRAQLDAIAWRALLERAQEAGSPEIRVWCAACATGEEAYTLALLAYEVLGPAPPPVRILATDISGAALAVARTGSYRERSLRHIPPGLRQRYFAGMGEPLVVGDRLRGIVQFAQHNLANGTVPEGEGVFDLIVCRNVLIYFDGATADHVIEGLRGALRSEGMLILGAADVLCGSVRRPITAVPGQPKQQASVARRLRAPLGLEKVTEVSAPLDTAAVELRFLSAIAELEGGDARAAAESLRHVLYQDPTFGLAAFALGRAHEATGDTRAARRAYQQALRTIDVTDERHDHLLQQVDLADVAQACRARLSDL